jgi:hypothetical protein
MTSGRIPSRLRLACYYRSSPITQLLVLLHSTGSSRQRMNPARRSPQEEQAAPMAASTKEPNGALPTKYASRKVFVAAVRSVVVDRLDGRPPMQPGIR